MTNEKDCGFVNGNNWFRYRAAGIIIENGAALFVGNAGCDYLYTVGGGVHMGETSSDCVCREVYEETGVHYDIDRLAVLCENFFVGSDNDIVGKECHCLEIYYLMKSRGNQELHSHSLNVFNNMEQMVWVPLDRIMEYDIRPDFLKEHIQELAAGGPLLHIITGKD